MVSIVLTKIKNKSEKQITFSEDLKLKYEERINKILNEITLAKFSNQKMLKNNKCICDYYCICKKN